MGSHRTVRVQQSHDKNVDDIHLEFNQDVEVEEVDGDSPKDSDSSIEDGGTDVSIGDFDKSSGDEIELRLEGKESKKIEINWEEIITGQ